MPVHLPPCRTPGLSFGRTGNDSSGNCALLESIVGLLFCVGQNLELADGDSGCGVDSSVSEARREHTHPLNQYIKSEPKSRLKGRRVGLALHKRPESRPHNSQFSKHFLLLHTTLFYFIRETAFKIKTPNPSKIKQSSFKLSSIVSE
jgi:hypothetical protein